MRQTHYEVLGIGSHASADEISAAFRRRAKELHPDVPGGDVEKFKRINEAYGVLKDSYKRSMYDFQSQLQAQSTNLRKPASRSEVWINIFASSLSCITVPVGRPLWKDIPSWFLFAEDDRMIVPETQRYMAERMKAKIKSHAVDHTPSVTAATVVVDVIREAIRSVTGS